MQDNHFCHIIIIQISNILLWLLYKIVKSSTETRSHTNTAVRVKYYTHTTAASCVGYSIGIIFSPFLRVVWSRVPTHIIILLYLYCNITTVRWTWLTRIPHTFKTRRLRTRAPFCRTYYLRPIPTHTYANTVTTNAVTTPTLLSPRPYIIVVSRII